MSNRVALVTGAGRGIGRGIAVALAQAGWQIIVNYRSNAATAEETVRLIEQVGGCAVPLRADIALADDRARLVAETISRLGRLDLLVNNAGMAPRQRIDILSTTEASYDEVMAVNLRGPFFLTQLAANRMIELLQAKIVEQAMIINIGSLSAYASSPNRPEYCISKAGLAMMTTLFSDRLAEVGIRVYEVRPGIVETDMTAVVHEKYQQLIDGGLTPIRRWGQPDDVAQAVVALAGGYFPFSTGEVINVDGGFHLRRL